MDEYLLRIYVQGRHVSKSVKPTARQACLRCITQLGVDTTAVYHYDDAGWGVPFSRVAGISPDLPHYASSTSAGDEKLPTSGSSSTATMSPSMARFMAIRSGMRMSCPTLSEATQPSAELNLLTRRAPCKTPSRPALGTQRWHGTCAGQASAWTAGVSVAKPSGRRLERQQDAQREAAWWV